MSITAFGGGTMSTSGAKHLASGTVVRVVNSGPIPVWTKWDDDRGRTSAQVKRRVMQLFFSGDKRIQAEVVWIPSESARNELTRKGRVKVKCKESSGTTLTFTADATNLKKR